VFAVIVASSRRRTLANLLLAVAAALLLYGVANTTQHALMVAGTVETPDALGETAVRWHLLLWDPIWLLGGLLFAATGWRSRRESR
jgi:hypothetical protein